MAIFKSGNYNAFESLVKEVLPSKSDLIRYEILLQIENTLKSMLGNLDNVRGESLDITQICNRQGLQGFNCNIVYQVLDFKVPEAPKDAIQEDIESISNNISREDAHLKSVNIDTEQGLLSITYTIPL